MSVLKLDRGRVAQAVKKLSLPSRAWRSVPTRSRMTSRSMVHCSGSTRWGSSAC